MHQPPHVYEYMRIQLFSNRAIIRWTKLLMKLQATAIYLNANKYNAALHAVANGQMRFASGIDCISLLNQSNV